MLQPQGCIDQKVASILLPAIRQLRINRLGKKGLLPIHLLREGADFCSRHAGRVHRADNAAHAGPGNSINGDVIFLQPLDHTDLCEPQSASATESQSNFAVDGPWKAQAASPSVPAKETAKKERRESI